MFNLLKREQIRRKTYRNRDEAQQDVFEYIEMFYNPNPAMGVIDTLEDGFMRGDEAQHPLDRARRIDIAELVGNRPDRSRQIELEGFRLTPVDEPTGALKGRQTSIDQFGDGVRALHRR